MENISTLKLKSPTTIEMTLTKECNHKCLHCYNPWRSEKKGEKQYFTKEQLKKFARELKDNEVWHVTISGGEPLTYFEALKNTTKEFDKNGIEYSVNSNLTLLTDEVASYLKQCKEFTNFILTSLPSIEEKTCDEITQVKGSYQRILKGIKLAKKYHIEVGINMVISKRNINDLNTITTFLKKFDIDYVSISLVIPPAYDQYNEAYCLTNNDIIMVADKLLEINKINKIAVDSVTPIPLCIIKNIDKYKNIINTSCSAGISRCTIDTNGDVFACSHEDKPYGNIFKEKLSEIWKRMDMWRNCENLNDECKQCAYLNICGGECRMHNKKNKNKKYTLNHNAEFVLDDDHLIKELSKPISKEQGYIINHYKERKESFGSAIRINYNEYFIDKEIIELLDFIKTTIGEKFFLKDLEGKIEFNQELYLALNFLEDNRIITKM